MARSYWLGRRHALAIWVGNSNGTNGRVGVQNSSLSKLLRWDWNLEKSIATGTHSSEPFDHLERRTAITVAAQSACAAVATSREGHRSRARSLGTPQQLVLRLFQGAPRPYWDCRVLRQLLKCEHTLQSFSDRLRPQTNIHSSARSAAPRTRARLPNQPQSH